MSRDKPPAFELAPVPPEVTLRGDQIIEGKFNTIIQDTRKAQWRLPRGRGLREYIVQRRLEFQANSANFFPFSCSPILFFLFFIFRFPLTRLPPCSISLSHLYSSISLCFYSLLVGGGTNSGVSLGQTNIANKLPIQFSYVENTTRAAYFYGTSGLEKKGKEALKRRPQCGETSEAGGGCEKVEGEGV